MDIDTALGWRGRTVVDRDGEKIGTLREIYLDDADRPAWASVHTALFGLRETFVPLHDARADEDRVQVPYDAEHVRAAPGADPDVQLPAEDEERLYRHYGASSGEDDAMTRSEEEVEIGTRRRPYAKVRLKKYVVTDYVEKEVPVRREKVELEREPPPVEGS
jgi:sporulation protein YlmC with PRC-barrel domain